MLHNMTTCPQTGALIFHTPAEVIEQRKQQEQLSKLQAENDKLKELVSKLIQLQPQSVQDQLA